MGARPLALAKFKQMALRLKGVPVLLYHELSAAAEPRLAAGKDRYLVSADQFRSHLELIRQHSYRVISLQDLWDSAPDSREAELSVVLTFDDGRASDYEVAYPFLLEKGFRAEFFVNTANIGRPGYVTWAQVEEMHRSAMVFQSHSHDHIVLSLLPARDLRRQLEKSKQVLEDRLGSAVDFLAIPYGMSNQRVVQAAHDVGYRAVCNSWPRPTRARRGVVNRVVVYGETKTRDLKHLLSNNPVAYGVRATRATLVYLPKQVLLRLWPSQLGVSLLEAKT